MASSVPRYSFLISKWLDPVFAVFVGVLSFDVYEKRVSREDGHRLIDLVKKRYLSDYYGRDKQDVTTVDSQNSTKPATPVK